jgi:hypothetical protein
VKDPIDPDVIYLISYQTLNIVCLHIGILLELVLHALHRLLDLRDLSNEL